MIAVSLVSVLGLAAGHAPPRHAMPRHAMARSLRTAVVAQQGTSWARDTASAGGVDALKDTLFSLLLDTSSLSGAFSRQNEVNEAVLALSSASPTAKPTSSPLLNGCWEVR